MAGVKGRSGAPGRPKSTEHRAAIAAGVRAFWSSEEGRTLRAAAREAARLRRLERRMENINGR